MSDHLNPKVWVSQTKDLDTRTEKEVMVYVVSPVLLKIYFTNRITDGESGVLYNKSNLLIYILLYVVLLIMLIIYHVIIISVFSVILHVVSSTPPIPVKMHFCPNHFRSLSSTGNSTQNSEVSSPEFLTPWTCKCRTIRM